MTKVTRRNAIGSVAVGAAGLALADTAAAQAAHPVVPAYEGLHQPRPLRFDPAKLTGLSEKLILSHWENNYQGSIKGLNTIETRLAAAMADKDFPPVVYSGLKREELHRTGSIVLHETYFDQLGGDGKAAGTVKAALAKSYGSFDAWEAEFRRTAMSLAGGSGWALLAWNHHTKSLHNYWCWDHTNGPAHSTPLLALDMYEHAFQMDYGAAAAKYVDAFMLNVDWEVVEVRFIAASKSGLG